MVATIRANTRLALLLLAIILLLPFQFLVARFAVRYWHIIPLFFHKLCMNIMGVELRVHGSPLKTPSTLYVSNHSSYLDITLLGSVLPASFIAKSEIAGWPIFGWLAILQRSVFVKRERKYAAEQRNDIESRLEKGDSLILFAEGTTSDGCRTLPFYSSLFESAHKAQHIQPISIVFTALDGIPAGRTNRMIYAWPGDVDLVPHFGEVIRQGDMMIDIVFHNPIKPTDFPNRKALSEYCYQKVSQGVSDLIAGRVYEPVVPDAELKAA